MVLRKRWEARLVEEETRLAERGRQPALSASLPDGDMIEVEPDLDEDNEPGPATRAQSNTRLGWVDPAVKLAAGIGGALVVATWRQLKPPTPAVVAIPTLALPSSGVAASANPCGAGAG
jgi:hypothetical protein